MFAAKEGQWEGDRGSYAPRGGCEWRVKTLFTLPDGQSRGFRVIRGKPHLRIALASFEAHEQ